jgi:hypothetical protein
MENKIWEIIKVGFVKNAGLKIKDTEKLVRNAG